MRLEKYWSLLITFTVIVVTVAWFWVFYFNTINSPFERDEGEYAYSAWLLSEGGVPYKEAFMQKPPMIIYTYFLAQRISTAVWAPRILAFIGVVFAALVLAAIAQRQYGKKAALLSLLLFPPLIAFPPFGAYSAQPEVFMVLPLVVSWWCYFKWEEHQKVWWLFGLGACLAVAILYKPIALPLSAMLSLYIGWRAYILGGRRVYACAQSLFSIMGGACVASLIILAPMFFIGAIPGMWESAFVFNRYYAFVSGFHFEIIASQISRIWVIPLGVIVVLAYRPKHWVFLIVVFLGTLMGTLGSVLLHYYIIVIPTAVMILAIALSTIMSFSARLQYLIYISAILIVALFVEPNVPRFSMNPVEVTQWRYEISSPFAESGLLAGKLQAISSPDDRVFVYGNEPQILYYAQRRSATRFVITYPLTLDTIKAEGYKQELIDGLRYEPPKFIVSEEVPTFFFQSNRPNSNPYRGYVVQMLKNQYRCVGGVVVDPDSGVFEYRDSWSQATKQQASLVLYQRLEEGVGSSSPDNLELCVK